MFAHNAFTAFQMIFLNNLFQNKFLEEDLAGWEGMDKIIGFQGSFLFSTNVICGFLFFNTLIL